MNFKHLSPYLKGSSFFLITALYLTALWWFEGFQTASLSGNIFLIQCLKYFGDAALIVFPFALLKPRFRYLVFIPVYISTIWVIGSIWNYRFWGDTPGVSTIFLFSNVGDELFWSLISLWHPGDFIFVILLISLTAAYALRWRKSVKELRFPIKTKWGIAAASLFFFIQGQCITSFLDYRYYNAVNRNRTFSQTTSTRLSTPIVINTIDLNQNTPIIHFIKSSKVALDVLFLQKELSDSERVRIEDFIASTPPPAILPDSLVQANRAKNVIMILVESLNADAIDDSVCGRPVAPVLRSLINQEGSISALNITTQVRAGGSGDGQLLATTGLHPLAAFSVPVALGSHNSFPALPLCLGKEQSVAVFADDAKSWNELSTFTSYGFKPVYSHLDYPDLITRYGGDGALLNFASSLIPELNQPFFMEMMTVSMHAPFNDVEIPAERRPKWPDASPDEDLNIRTYHAMLNYFDTELGLFIERLKKLGVYDNTMLIIVSDHSQELFSQTEAKTQKSTPMALIITNSGITARIDNAVGQVDVFPTVLNLFNASGPKGWRGVGESILSGNVNAAFSPMGIVGTADSKTAARLNEAVEISELIHRTNYFAR